MNPGPSDRPPQAALAWIGKPGAGGQEPQGQWGHPGQLSLPLEYEVAPGVPAIPPTPTHLHLVGSAEPEVLTEPSTEGEPTL
ncbi:MAG: hypothetical protein ACK5CQ_15225, partial [Cyanobacteriota bacterium]